MKRLIRLQLRNIFHNKLFYVCTIITLVLSVAFSYIGSLLTKGAPAPTVLPEIVSLFTSGVDIIGMIFITVFCTFDFSEGTTKNIVARGYSKVKLLLSKYIASFIGIIALDLIVSAVIFVLYIKNGLGYQSTMPIQFIYSIFSILAFTIFYGTIAFVLEKTSTSIIANMFLPNIIALALATADTNLKVNMSKYWIGSVGAKFIENPTVAHIGFPLLMYLVYIIIFAFIGIYITKNKEIK